MSYKFMTEIKMKSVVMILLTYRLHSFYELISVYLTSIILFIQIEEGGGSGQLHKNNQS